MVVLRVVLEDFRLLFVVKGPYELVDAKVFPPFFAVYKPRILPQLTAVDVNGIAYICFARSTLNFRARRNLSF